MTRPILDQPVLVLILDYWSPAYSRSLGPSHLSVDRRNEYQPHGGDVLRLGSEGRHGSCVGGR